MTHVAVVADVAARRHKVPRVAWERRRRLLGGRGRIGLQAAVDAARVGRSTEQCAKHGVLLVDLEQTRWNDDLGELVDAHRREMNQPQCVSKHLST